MDEKKNKLASANGVGKKFLIISISITIFLNGAIAIWFIWFIKKFGTDRFFS